MSDDQPEVTPTDQPEVRFAERMFPAPVDLGIARPDRAVSSVTHGTEAYLTGRGGDGTAWYQGGGAASDRAVQGITIYPPTGGVQTQGDPFEPVKIGILIDMDLNQLLADWIDPTILAIEDALNELALELQRARTFGFTERELDDVKKAMMSGAERSVRTARSA